MQRLFAIRNSKKQLYPTTKAPQYFANKMKAKEMRDTLNDAAGNALFFVTVGPDHLRYKG